MRAVTGRRDLRITQPVLSVDAVMARAEVVAIPGRYHGTLIQPTKDSHECALRLGAWLADDVGDAVDGVRSPYRAARAADHLDPVDIRKERVLRIPEGPAGQARVGRPAVHQDEHLVGRADIEPAGADPPGAAVHAPD